MNKSFILKLATGLWWTVPFAFICKLAVKASHPNLSAAIGEYIEGCLWAVAALVALQLAIHLGLALWETVFGPVKDASTVSQTVPLTASAAVQHETANAAPLVEPTEGNTQENAHPENTNVKITLLPDDEDGEEAEPEFV